MLLILVNNVVDAELDRSTTATSAEDSNSTNSGRNLIIKQLENRFSFSIISGSCRN